MKLYHIEMLYLLWLLPALAGLFFYVAYKRKQLAQRFAAPELLQSLRNTVSVTRRRWKALFLLLTVFFLVLALARPAWNPIPRTVAREGRDVVFLLDVSRSMLADDLAPNRLERAKLAIRDCLEQLQGDRVGLVLFAGHAVATCPLTLDYGFFRMALENTTVNSVSRGGTKLGDAIRTTLGDVFDDQEKAYKDIILITDGEDQDSFPVEAASDAGKKGIRMLAIGLGDETHGRRIPVIGPNGEKQFLTYEGKEVWTKLDADTLREMAAATPGGRYLNVATGAFDLGEIYRSFIASADKKALEAQKITRYEEKFQIFLVPALLFLVVEFLLTDRKKKVALPSIRVIGKVK